MPEWAGAGALAAKLVLVAQCDVQYAALAAVHRVEPERSARVLDFFGGGVGADPQLFDAERAVIVRVEGYARMIVGVESQNLLRNQFERKEKLRAIGEKQLCITAGELDDDVRIFEIRMT